MHKFKDANNKSHYKKRFSVQDNYQKKFQYISANDDIQNFKTQQ